MSNEDLVRRFSRLWVTRDYDELSEIVAEDFVAHNGPDEVRGADGWRKFVEDGWKQFGAIDTGIDELIEDRGLLAERWWFKAGTGDGPHLSSHGITVHRVVDGRLQENWAVAASPDE